jgi:hypothetical protein
LTNQEAGKILGYPPCCVKQWCQEHERIGGGQAKRRGLIDLGERDKKQRYKLGAIFNVDAKFFTRKIYVPCDDHVGTTGWRKF